MVLDRPGVLSLILKQLCNDSQEEKQTNPKQPVAFNRKEADSAKGRVLDGYTNQMHQARAATQNRVQCVRDPLSSRGSRGRVVSFEDSRRRGPGYEDGSVGASFSPTVEANSTPTANSSKAFDRSIEMRSGE
jgi:hypothetical protein